MRIRKGYFLIAAVAVIAACLLPSCRGSKLKTANEQFDRGEFYNAAQTYRKVYNKLTKRDERPQRGVVAYQMATCYRRLNQAEGPLPRIRMLSGISIPTPWLFTGSDGRCRPQAVISRP